MTTDGRGARGARPASNQIMRFLDAFAPGKSIAALRIPHKGISTEQRGHSRCKTRLELDSAVFSGAMCRTKLLPRSVFRTREHPQSSGSARGGKACLESNYAVFSGAMCRTKLLPRSVFHHKGTSTEQRGCSRGQGPPRIGLYGFSGAKRLKNRPAVTGMGDATRT